MTMPIDLVLVRHGESEGNVANHRSKRGDHSDWEGEFGSRHTSKWRLSKRGREQARMAGEWLGENLGTEFFRRYVSSYNRAMETAALLGLPGSWFVEPYLRERDWGALDAMSWEERRAKFADELERRRQDTFYWAPPGGESLAQVCLRVDRVLNTLHRECTDHRVIIVCHGEVMWAFRVRLERMSQARYHELDKSDNPLDRIHNCQILHYTRKNPETGEISRRMDWLRSICPTDLFLSKNEWEPIVRPRFTNADLLEIVEQTPPIIEG